MGFGAAAFLMAGAIWHSVFLGTVSLFFLLLIGSGRFCGRRLRDRWAVFGRSVAFVDSQHGNGRRVWFWRAWERYLVRWDWP